jgi:hypothetical protein
MNEKLTQGPEAAKEMSRHTGAAAQQSGELARRIAQFPMFAWLGERLLEVQPWQLYTAKTLVDVHGDDPHGEAVARALGVDAAAAAEAVRAGDVRRRMRRKTGEPPPGKPLEERRRHVAVRILVRWLARLCSRRPRRADGTKLGVRAAALLATVTGPSREVEYAEDLEAHPRAHGRRMRLVESGRRAQVVSELDAMKRGELGPSASTRTLPARVCGATRRNHRRVAEARESFEADRFAARAQRLERQSVQGRMHNPQGIRKHLPLAEGRKARAIYHDRFKALSFLMGLPLVLRVRLFEAATQGGRRGRFGEEALRLYAFFAYLQFQAETPRPVVRREGFDRAVEGLSREALAVAFAWNPRSEQPFHANTISAMAAMLEEAGLVGRETPNSVKDAYKGVTGWALYIYRLRTAEQLNELLAALGEDWGARGAEDQVVIEGDASS